MTEIYISHLASALGSQVRAVEDTGEAGLLLSDPKALRDAGFAQHHYCAEGEDAFSLALGAMQASDIDTAKVDCLIFATCLPVNGNVGSAGLFNDSRDVKHLMDFPASRLQSELGMDRAFVIGLNQQACTGMLGSIRLARNMLVAEPELQKIVCVTADRFPPAAIYEQSYNLISDGAAVCLASREEAGFRVLAYHHVTNGALVQASDDETVGSYFTNVYSVVMKALDMARLEMKDIHWVIPQNTNRKAWKILAGLLGVADEQSWFKSMAEAAHVISADNIINLAQLEASGNLASGDRVLTFMAGYGANWQCLVLERV